MVNKCEKSENIFMREVFGNFERGLMINIPNSITLTRILMTPLSIYSLSKEAWIATTIIFFIAIASDYLDGILARRLNQETKLGALIDPIADKIFIGSVAVFYVIKGLVPVWLVFIVLFRDIALLVLGSFLVNKEIDMSPCKSSKINTTIIMLMFISIPILKIFNINASWYIITSSIAAAVLTIHSGVIYGTRFVRFIKIKEFF